MDYQWGLHLLPLIAAVILSAGLALLAWQRRHVPGAVAFTILMLAVAEWSAAYVLELTASGVSAKLFWIKVQYVGIVTVPVAWLAFALGYARRTEWLTRRNLVLLAIVPLITVLMTWTNELHHLMTRQAVLDTRGPFPTLDLARGSWFWVHVGYSYALNLIGTVAFVHKLLITSHVYRRQVSVLLVGALVPWVGNVLYVLEASPLPNVDLTSFAFTLTGLVMMWGLFRYRLLDLAPVAHDAVIEGMRDGVVVLDVHDQIVDLNPAAERIIGRSAAKATGQPVTQVVSGWLDIVERHRDATETPIEIALGEGGTGSAYDVRVSPFYDGRGRPSGRLIVLRDITERRRAEEALRESKRRLELALHGGDLGTWDWDIETGEMQVDERWTKMKGYALDEIEPRVGTWEGLVHPEDQPAARENLEAHLAGKTPSYEAEYRMRHKSGEWVWILARGKVIERDAQDRPLRACGTHLDITAHKRMDEQLRHQERLASLGRLAGGIAHDFNNILASIILYAQMPLNNPDLAPTNRSALEIILEESHHAADLVQQILDFARSAMLDTGPISMVALVEEKMALLRRTIPESIRLVTEMTVHPCVVQADRSRIHQALMNLALNARDAMPKGGELRIGVERIIVEPDDEVDSLLSSAERPSLASPAGLPEMLPGAWACLTVGDTGTGMSEEVQDHLFEPFFTTKEVDKGRGLGLAQVHGIVKQHGGFIDVDTALGEGTTVTIFLPLVEDEDETAERKAVSLHPDELTILVVEDAERLRRAVQAGLESIGYQVVTAANGQEALETVSLEEVDLVLTDVVMPKMGGEALLRQLATRAPQLSVIAMTGHAMEEGELQRAGFAGALLKPFSMEELTQTIRTVLDG